MKLSGMEQSWLERILEALVPRGGEVSELSAVETGAVEMLEEMLLYLPAMTGLGLRAAAVAIEVMGPRIGLGRRTRFSGLGLAEREECLVRLAKSDNYLMRQLVLLLKSVACLAWCGDPRVRAALGHELPPRFVKRDGQ